MAYLFEYFDLNKRGGEIQPKGVDAIDQLISANKSELKLKIVDPLEKQNEENLQNQRAISELAEENEDEEEDQLYNDMAKFWDNNDRSSNDDTDRRDLEQRPFSLKEKLQLVKSTSPIPWWQQVTLYFGIIIGALFSSTILEYQIGTNNPFEISLPFVVLASTMAIIISPVAFEKLCMNLTGSFYTRLFLFIQNGAFWYILVSAFYFTLAQMINLTMK